jgi:hypothetical protein
MKYEEIQNDYRAYWHIIKDENQHPALIANCMRNIISWSIFFILLRKKILIIFFKIRSCNAQDLLPGDNFFDIDYYLKAIQ